MTEPTTTRPRPVTVPFEQAVYGSFAFRGEGYAVLARSPGCREEWITAFRAACQKMGERPASAVDAAGLVALRLPAGPWAVVRVSPQGCDDRGRPGALGFHALFVTPRDYRRAGADPFALAGLLRSDWSAADADRPLPAGSVAVEPTPDGAGVPPADSRAGAIAAALARGRRVALESPGPIDDLARDVWRALPARVRRRASVATWAFGNGNRFDLLAAPRLAALALDGSYVDPAAAPAAAPAASRRDGVGWRWALGLGLAALLGAGAVGLARRGAGGDDVPGPPAPRADAARPGPATTPPPPPDDDAGADPAERRRVAEALAELADRFADALPAAGGRSGRAGDRDPVALMERLAAGLRYGGPYLSDAERAALAADPARDAALALRWDDLARKFAADRPLPGDFRRRSLRGQLAALAWSFHTEGAAGAVEPGGPRRAASEVAQALAEALAVDFPVRPLAPPLPDRHPALAAYRAFLGRLPRR